jgi:hypothetical protein
LLPRFLRLRSATANHFRREGCGVFSSGRNLRRDGDLIHALAPAAKGEAKMQETLMLSLAASIMLGMWVIWRITP